MKNIDLSYEYFLRILVHKEKNIIRAMNGFLDLYRKKSDDKYLMKVNECINEFRLCTSKLDQLSRESSLDLAHLKNHYSQASQDGTSFVVYIKDIHEFDNLESYFNPFLEFFELALMAIKNDKNVKIDKVEGKLKVVLS